MRQTRNGKKKEAFSLLEAFAMLLLSDANIIFYMNIVFDTPMRQ
jgi:hypothetical protein